MNYLYAAGAACIAAAAWIGDGPVAGLTVLGVFLLAYHLGAALWRDLG